MMNIVGFDYFGARYYSSDLSVWLSVDPLASKYPSMSPYMYVAGNPVMLVDPDGMQIDDYFNSNGDFLGSDEAETDNVRVMGQNQWDALKTKSADGTESIDHEMGNSSSVAFSESGISDESTLKVYDHYNPMDVPLVAHEDENGRAGMTLNTKRTSGEIDQKIMVKIEANKRLGDIDNANVIKNMFSHEKKHFDDIIKLGLTKYVSLPKSIREQRAIKAQMSDPSWIKTNTEYQDGVKRYGRSFGLEF